MRSSRRTCGFTLIELVVVIAIIAIVAAISIPAMSGVRDTSRLTQTRGLIQSLENATSQFKNDNQGRQPGYFSPKEMGRDTNISAGMSTMSNMLLDLVGGVVDTPPLPTPNPPDLIEVSPYTTGSIKVLVDLNKMGTGKYFVLPGGSWSKSAGQPNSSGYNNPLMPDLVDAFGTPILAWVEDDAAVTQVKTVTDFAKEHSGTAGGPLSAKFYWAQNARWLSATSVGRKLVDQNSDSLIGGSQTDKVASLAGILGSPAFPYREPNAANTVPPIVAAKARAPIVFHSAGKDGIYFGKDETGAKQFATAKIDYKINFVSTANGTLPGAGYTDKNGNPSNIDVVEKFNDLLVGTGN